MEAISNSMEAAKTNQRLENERDGEVSSTLGTCSPGNVYIYWYLSWYFLMKISLQIDKPAVFAVGEVNQAHQRSNKPFRIRDCFIAHCYTMLTPIPNPPHPLHPTRATAVLTCLFWSIYLSNKPHDAFTNWKRVKDTGTTCSKSCCIPRGRGALTLERGMWMCCGHDPPFSDQSPLPSLPIYHQCAALVPLVFNF